VSSIVDDTGATRRGEGRRGVFSKMGENLRDFFSEHQRKLGTNFPKQERVPSPNPTPLAPSWSRRA